MRETVRECCKMLRDRSGQGDSRLYRELIDEELLTKSLKQLEVDSLSLFEFVMEVENRYSIELDEARIQDCKTAGDLFALIETALDATDSAQ